MIARRKRNHLEEGEASRPGALALSLLPGLLLGVLFAQILFFLNPHLPFSRPLLARAALTYGTSGALASLLLLLPWTVRRPRSGLRLVPWAETLVLTLAATLGWSLPSYYGFFLPPGINVRLIKAAFWLTLLALICFYTALLHSVYRRRYGMRSRLALVLAAVVAVYVLAERRGAFPAAPESVRSPTIVETARRPRLVVVGIESASLDGLLPMAEQGLLPFFGRVLEGGASGYLSSLAPNRPGALWTTVATGKYPYKHGIVSRRIHRVRVAGEEIDLKLLPPLGPFRSWAKLRADRTFIDGRSREVLALWEVLSGLGVETGIVGWPVTSPPPPGLAFALSDRAFGEPAEARGEIRPADLAPRARLFRMQASDPEAEPDLPAGIRAPGRVRAGLATDLWRQSLAAYLSSEAEMQGEESVDALFLALPGLKEATSRYFGGYSAVQFEGSQEPAYLEAAEMVRAYYRSLDGILADLWARQDEPSLLVVVSSYGPSPPQGWQRVKAELSERRSLEGRFEGSPGGLILLYGEGVRPGARIDGAKLVDVMPTVLYGLGFPVARDLDGQALRQAFKPSFLAEQPLSFVASYEYLRETAPTLEPVEVTPEEDDRSATDRLAGRLPTIDRPSPPDPQRPFRPSGPGPDGNEEAQAMRVGPPPETIDLPEVGLVPGLPEESSPEASPEGVDGDAFFLRPMEQ